MIIGNFKKTKKGYEGTIETLLFTAEAVIEPINSRSGKAPDFRVLTAAGREMGVAWKQSSENTGKAYLSVAIEDPSVSLRNCFLHKTDTGDYVLTWNRARRKSKAKSTQPDSGQEF
ncbi:DUF736 domain-containing protein [Ktedonosporobacter rubrisoli]|uniref:DUF736 domain-containing protein n=1 Tax=Ktedonosporobacter rubrisoli TaxID=2509675 RepID=A0A4P6JJA4_KTERU|nr:DUF736 domain-containing protein [Ktedonosporobacter rubrisoli]QBD75197.1 DUF736 domain-containing protein [Ktedonosporobacter rubrisoli]